MGSHKGREGQGARTAFRKAPQASPPETRFTVEVNDFLERFKLLELGLTTDSERAFWFGGVLNGHFSLRPHAPFNPTPT